MEAVATRGAQSVASVHADFSWMHHFKFSHTSNGYNYYTDVTGRYYAHDEEGQWYIQDAKGRFILWTAPEDMSNAVATKDEAPTKSGNAIQTAIAEEPMANQCVEMEICGDDDMVVDADANKPTNDNDVTAAKGTDLQQADEPKELHQAALQSTSHGSTNLGGVKGSAGLTTRKSLTARGLSNLVKRSDISEWEEYSRQYYQQYGYMPTYEMFSDGTASGGGQAFSNAGWIVTGGRRTKVRPEDIDLPPGPPPSASTGLNHYPYGFQHYMGYAAQAMEHQRGGTASSSIVRQMKQFVSLKSKKEESGGIDSSPGNNEVSSLRLASAEGKATNETGEPSLAAKTEDVSNGDEAPSAQSVDNSGEGALLPSKDSNDQMFDGASLERCSECSRSTGKSKRSRRKRSRSSSSLQSHSSFDSKRRQSSSGQSPASSYNSRTSGRERTPNKRDSSPPSQIPALDNEGADNIYQPVFVLTTETELPWPSSHVRRTKCSPSITYSCALRGAFKHLLAAHRKIREETWAKRCLEIEEQLSKISSSEWSSSEQSDSDISEKTRSSRSSSATRSPARRHSRSTGSNSSRNSVGGSNSRSGSRGSVGRSNASSCSSGHRSRSRSRSTNVSVSATSPEHSPKGKRKSEKSASESSCKPEKSEKIYSTSSSE